MKPINDKFLWDIIDRLRGEVEELKLLSCDDDCQDTINHCNKLKAENKELKADIRHDASVCEEYEEGLREEIKELQAEIKRLNRVNAELSGKLQAVNDSFKAEIKELKAEVDKEKEFAIETSIKNDRLMDQVSSNSGNSSSTHTHTIGKEIAEYIENNDKCKDARLFIVPIEDFDEDECCNKWLTWDEGIE